ncbi:hypothetical protein OPV22_005907 [Ensete ventricosum]|uniref:Uncharacterized protein n=1 Tax=Ensete ventricosum TaxID=4639 RepID=A0AAV8RQH8_ENSVE|nr:hypothetical protein OPV22_005907 [Ensete ventricosum]
MPTLRSSSRPRMDLTAVHLIKLFVRDLFFAFVSSVHYLSEYMQWYKQVYRIILVLVFPYQLENVYHVLGMKNSLLSVSWLTTSAIFYKSVDAYESSELFVKFVIDVLSILLEVEFHER